MRIAIDLLWVRVGKVGGTEAYTRSILDSIIQYDQDNDYVLLVSEDNEYSFRSLADSGNIEIKTCKVKSARAWKRIIWENIFLHKVLKDLKLDLIFIPIYFKPFLYGVKIPCICTIHDLQAFHYPEYFSVGKRLFLKLNWAYTCKSANYILTDSDFCKQDIINHYPVSKNKVETLYVPVPNKNSTDVFEELKVLYQIEHQGFFYCVSSLLPHKNLETIFRFMSEYKKKDNTMKLVISGVGGNEKQILELIYNLKIEQNVVFTGFITDEERDSLYQHCYMFLFPSIFEGFGIPPIEAMQFGAKTIMTKKSCLYETSKGYAYYVEEPKDVKQWLHMVESVREVPAKIYIFDEYQEKYILQQLLTIFRKVFDKTSNKKTHI